MNMHSIASPRRAGVAGPTVNVVLGGHGGGGGGGGHHPPHPPGPHPPHPHGHGGGHYYPYPAPWWGGYDGAYGYGDYSVYTADQGPVVCAQWSAPIDNVSAELLAYANQRLLASKNQPVTAELSDGALYLFAIEGRATTIRKCLDGSLGAQPARHESPSMAKKAQLVRKYYPTARLIPGLTKAHLMASGWICHEECPPTVEGLCVTVCKPITRNLAGLGANESCEYVCVCDDPGTEGGTCQCYEICHSGYGPHGDPYTKNLSGVGAPPCLPGMPQQICDALAAQVGATNAQQALDTLQAWWNASQPGTPLPQTPGGYVPGGPALSIITALISFFQNIASSLPLGTLGQITPGCWGVPWQLVPLSATDLTSAIAGIWNAMLADPAVKALLASGKIPAFDPTKIDWAAAKSSPFWGNVSTWAPALVNGASTLAQMTAFVQKGAGCGLFLKDTATITAAWAAYQATGADPCTGALPGGGVGPLPQLPPPQTPTPAPSTATDYTPYVVAAVAVVAVGGAAALAVHLSKDKGGRAHANPLRSSIDSPTVEREVRSAAAARFGRGRKEVFFDHGHWWVRFERMHSGVVTVYTYDVIDTNRGLDFELLEQTEL